MVKSLLKQCSPETVESINEIRDCWEMKTMLHHAAKGDNIEVVKYLVEEKRADVNAVDRNGMSVLHDSVKSMKVMRYLIEERRADINTINKDGMSILHSAVANGSMEAIRYLIEEKKLDINVRSKRNSTPLHLAISALNEDDVERVQYLIEKGADIKAVNKYGTTPLNLARWENTKIVILLEEAQQAAVNPEGALRGVNLKQPAKHSSKCTIQ